VGKNWAKGLTAATDSRIARMAATRRGRKRGPYRLRARSPLVWSPELAYAVGLIATDGNLSPSGRHVSVSSGEREVLETFLRCIDRRAKIGHVKGGFGTHGLRVQIGDVGLYRWLQSIGLTPRKSLTLGPIDVPDAVLCHLLRGLLDGDGSVIDCTYDGTGRRGVAVTGLFSFGSTRRAVNMLNGYATESRSGTVCMAGSGVKMACTS